MSHLYILAPCWQDSDFWTVFQDPFLNIAPKKPNWDLRRDVQKKLDKLEKRTQKAIFQLMGMLYSLTCIYNLYLQCKLAMSMPLGDLLSQAVLLLKYVISMHLDNSFNSSSSIKDSWFGGPLYLYLELWKAETNVTHKSRNTYYSSSMWHSRDTCCRRWGE